MSYADPIPITKETVEAFHEFVRNMPPVPPGPIPPAPGDAPVWGDDGTIIGYMVGGDCWMNDLEYERFGGEWEAEKRAQQMDKMEMRA